MQTVDVSLQEDAIIHLLHCLFGHWQPGNCIYDAPGSSRISAWRRSQLWISRACPCSWYMAWPRSFVFIFNQSVPIREVWQLTRIKWWIEYFFGLVWYQYIRLGTVGPSGEIVLKPIWSHNSDAKGRQKTQKLIFTSCNQEWDASKRRELIHHPSSPTCLFGDIAQFFTPAVQAILPQLHQGDMFQTKLMPLVASGKAVQPKLVLYWYFGRLLSLLVLWSFIIKASCAVLLLQSCNAGTLQALFWDWLSFSNKKTELANHHVMSVMTN